MPVQDYMSKDLITVDEETSIMKASKLMKQNGIRHLPILRKGRLVGIVSDRELKEATPSKATTLDIHEMYYLLDQITVKRIAEILVEETGLKGVKIKYTGGDRGWKGDVPIVRLETRRIRSLGWENVMGSREALKASMCSMLDDARAGRL